MAKKMETTGYRVIEGLCRGNGKEHGNYYSILGLYRDNGKEPGNYCDIFSLYRWILRILHDPTYLLFQDLWNYSITRSCRIFCTRSILCALNPLPLAIVGLIAEARGLCTRLCWKPAGG